MLVRPGLSLAVAFSAVVGVILSEKRLTWLSLSVFFGVLLLSWAASALNQVQERRLDAAMPRTRNRPVASGSIKPHWAIVSSVVFSLAGLCILFFSAGPVPAGLGLAAMLWYNAVYTPLKARTRYSVLVGALTGAVPPLIGWTAAGGHWSDPGILAIALFLFFWQIAHFSLLLLKYGGEYSRAGFPAFLTGTAGDRRTVFILLVLVVLSTLLFPAFRLAADPVPATALCAAGLLMLVFYFPGFFSRPRPPDFRLWFRVFYSYQLAVLLILIFSSL